MKNNKKLYLMGYTVCGIDRRDDSYFEDFYVSETDLYGGLISHNKFRSIEEAIDDYYNLKGFYVSSVMPESKSPVRVELDLMELYKKQKDKEIKQNDQCE